MNVIFSMTLAAGMALGEQEVVMFNERLPVPTAGQRTTTYFSRSSNDVVKGAPYSAESITEHVQGLPDGNRISHSNKSNFARDTEGRTRRETTIQGLGPVGQTEEPVVSVFIEDPVAKLQYTLDSQRKVALKQKSDGGMNFKIATSPIGMASMPSVAAVSGHAVGGIAVAGTTVHRDEVIVERKIVAEGKEAQRVEATVSMKARTTGDLKKEDLGTRNMEGVSVKGTKTIMTIPVGEVGNERPIEVVTETWYSEEIKAVVLTKHSDPRTGEMTNRLSNIRLGEPSKSLFEPPSDYKVEEISNMRMPMAMPAIRVKEDR